MSYYLSMGLELLGSTVASLIGLAMLIGVIYWQYREFKSWVHSRRAYLLLKIGAPVIFILMGLLASAVAGTISGMEALGVFYLGMIIALFAAPISVAMLAPFLGIPFKAAAKISGSLFATLLAAFYGVSMFISASGNVVNRDWDYERSKHQREESVKNPELAKDRAAITQRSLLMLPDGNRLLHLTIAADPGWLVHQIEMTQPKKRTSTNVSYCHEGQLLHVFDIFDGETEAGLSVFYYQPDQPDGPYIALNTAISIPPGDVFDEYLQLYEHGGSYTLTSTLPARTAVLVKEKQQQAMTDVLSLTPVNTAINNQARRYENNPCLPLNMNLPALDHLSLMLMSQSFGGNHKLRLSPRHLAPEYR